MDLVGSLVDTNLRIYPGKKLLDYVKTIPIDDSVPVNIGRLVKGRKYDVSNKAQKENTQIVPVHLNSKDIENLNKIKSLINIENDEDIKEKDEKKAEEVREENNVHEDTKSKVTEKEQPDGKLVSKTKLNQEGSGKGDDLDLTTSDIDWLYTYLQNQRNNGVETVPYLHALLENSKIETPENEVIRRNPDLEARCVKLRAQQEAREYRKMTKSVDNVRMRFPEDSINYQLKQLNRQLIAIGQFIISIFAGFLFGFRGVEWMVGNLDFGFRLLLGVMCALVIALAEIYFLAKKLNEEFNIPETVQLGGPPKFADQNMYFEPKGSKAIDKEHQD